MTEIRCKLSTLDTAIKALDRYQKQLESKLHTAVEKISDVGNQVASSEFASAVYDGNNDVSVKSEWTDKKTVYVVAKGDAVCFIEFGTGVTYLVPAPYEPEYPIEGLVGRGEFGHRLGRLDSWYYNGSPGSNGEVVRDGKHKGMVETQGNPANLCMYYAVKEMKKQGYAIVKEVFSE